jgi:hypothetical protein
VNLFAPVGGILALDTFIRNKSGGAVNIAGPVKGADNIKSNNVNSSVALAAPSVPASLPNTPTTNTDAGTQDLSKPKDAASNKSGILTVELLSLGAEGMADAPAAGNINCDDPSAKQDKQCVKDASKSKH